MKHGRKLERSRREPKGNGSPSGGSQSSELSSTPDAGWIFEEAALILQETPGDGKPKNLMERTARFGESIILLGKKVPRTAGNDPLIGQLVRAGTSVGANYCEADDAVSPKDFRHKVGICRKESKEAMFFLRMIAASEESLKDEARVLWKEAKELNLIFGSIWRKTG
jgi:four helix bundle protein